MSKNFELIQQADYNLNASSPAENAPQTPNAGIPFSVGNGHVASAGKGFGVLNLDKITREECLKIAQRVFLGTGTDAPRAVVFAGVDHGNGCSQVCAQTAEILASNVPGSVCIVEANLRTPSLPSFFGTTNHFGLTDAFGKKDPVRNYAKQVRQPNLWLLSSGSIPGGTSCLVGSEQMRSKLAELRTEFDYLLIDAPPLKEYSDAIVLGQLTDGMVLVLEANSTRREVASRVADNLRSAQIRILGAVLNKRTFPIPNALYQRL